MTQLATRTARANEAAAYVRLKVAERGWTEEIEAMAMQHVSEGEYPCCMSEMFMEELVKFQTPIIRNWLTPAARRWTRLVYGRGGWFIVGGWLLWLVFAWYGVKVLLYFGVLAVMLALFVLTAGFDLATYPLRKR